MPCTPGPPPPLTDYLAQMPPEMRRALVDYVLSEWYRDVGGPPQYGNELQGRFIATVEDYKYEPRRPKRTTRRYRAL